MSNTARIAATAANTLTKPLNIEDVFSTYLYEGNSSTQTITNGIDLSGEGGLVWFKARSGTYGTSQHALFDTDRGVLQGLASSLTSAEATEAGSLTSFNSNGFDLGSWGGVNGSGSPYASWTFRKAPKFFDVVTATSIGSTSRVLSHNLGCDVGFAVVKRLDSTSNWISRHRSLTAGHNINLNTTQASFTFSGIVSFDSTTITINEANFLGTGNYVVYLFAHNDGDGDFGPTGDQDIIKCGSVSYNGGASVDLGFEPQWVLIKPSNNTGNWILNDVMRGMPNGSRGPWLQADTSSAELANATVVYPTSTGFTMPAFLYDPTDLIYIAIRRGPMAVPESATDVFDIATRDGTEPGFDSSFPVDFALTRTVNTADNWWAASRLNQGKYLQTNGTNAEASASSLQFDYMDGWNANAGVSSTLYSWMWKRAPNYFDVVAYTGNGTAGRTVSHNLGVAPEMMWVKSRSNAYTWVVYHKGLNGGTNPEQYYLRLDTTGAEGLASSSFNDTAPTASNFTLGIANSTNGSGNTYIAYLFASLDGVSKVGSYTGNGSITGPSIDCGFSAGPRFVLIKRSDGEGQWWVFDTERGLTSGNDPYMFLNLTSASQDGYDLIDPTSSGFQIVTNEVQLNASGGSYIFYAIA